MNQEQPKSLFSINCAPGIQRDGSSLDTSRYTDGQWVRFQRGRPKKMSGYREISDRISGPVRGLTIWSRQDLIQITTFSPYGVEALQVDQNGIGQNIFNRTPSGWTDNTDIVWQYTTMYDAAAGSEKTLLIAHPGENLSNIDSGTANSVYYGDASGTAALTAISPDVPVSGGVLALPPYLVLYGSDGLVKWSNANEPRNFASGDANTARVTGAKVVKGLAIRGQGQAPAAIFWSLDSVIKMNYVGGQAVFRFDTVSDESSILSSSSPIEYDGVLYWVGIDRFMMYDGSVHELPNDQNQNWFFDNLNYAYRQLVHATKITRYGEIWWFYPRGDATECTHAVIYNVREKCWYDAVLDRSAATYPQVFRYPVMTDSVADRGTARLGLTGITGAFTLNETVTGGTSTASGTISKLVDDDIYVDRLNSAATVFINGETVTGASSGATATVGTGPTEISLYTLWLHEFGKNKVLEDDELAIESYFQTADFGFPTGGADGEKVVGADLWTRLTRVEPDFNQTGTMTMEVVAREAAQSDESTTDPVEFEASDKFIDKRVQARQISLKFSSNDMNGDFEMGKVILHVEEGDKRA